MSWDHCVGIYTDGAPSMTGRLKGFVTRVKVKNPLIISTHCFLHREALMIKTMKEDLLVTLNDAVHVLNYIKGRPLKSRIFAAICESMDSEFKCLLYHTEIRWLSRGKVLVRLYKMKEKVMLFLMTENNKKYADLFADDDRRAKLAYLADIFGHLNVFNVFLQRPQLHS